MRTVLYTGQESIWSDIRKFVATVKAKHHRINSELKMRQLVTRVTTEQAKTVRTSYLHIFIPGPDILSDDIEQIPAWNGLSAVKQQELNNATLPQKQAMIRLPGLTRSYAWSERNQWAQQMEEGDYQIIMATPARQVLWDPDEQGPWTPQPRAFDDPELFPFETLHAHSHKEAELILQERKRRNYVPGASLG